MKKHRKVIIISQNKFKRQIICEKNKTKHLEIIPRLKIINLRKNL